MRGCPVLGVWNAGVGKRWFLIIELLRPGGWGFSELESRRQLMPAALSFYGIAISAA